MHIAGIIAEYDPFHKGHAAHIAATRQNGATHIITVLSGSFTQRGEPAMLSKFCRTEMALAGGADLVIELPLPWSMAPAERFAAGGVAVLHALGCVDTLSFGSECGETQPLERLADLSTTPEYVAALQKALSSGIPYAAAGQAAAEAVVGYEAAAHLAHPNNTLGIEYIRAARQIGAHFRFFTLSRQGALHSDDTPKDGFASATLIRRAIVEERHCQASPYMPDATFSLLDEAVRAGEVATCTDRLAYAVLARLRRMSPEQIAALPDLSEGLEYRLHKAAQGAATPEELIAQIKTRRYPLSRIRRIMWSVLLETQKADTEGLPPYIRVLGMNRRGRDILSRATPTLPVISRSSQINELDSCAKRVWTLECAATDLRALLLAKPQTSGVDQTAKFLFFDKEG